MGFCAIKLAWAKNRRTVIAAFRFDKPPAQLSFSLAHIVVVSANGYNVIAARVERDILNEFSSRENLIKFIMFTNNKLTLQWNLELLS
jgi:hypothetical protein